MYSCIKNEQTELNKTLKSGIPVAVYQPGWALLWKFLTAPVGSILRFSYGENQEGGWVTHLHILKAYIIKKQT